MRPRPTMFVMLGTEMACPQPCHAQPFAFRCSVRICRMASGRVCLGFCCAIHLLRAPSISG